MHVRMAWALRAVVTVTVTMLLDMALPMGGLAATPPEPILGVASGEMSDPGSLAPVGYGHFVIQDRVYAGRSLGRSVLDEWGACFSGTLTSTEDWALDATRMAGAHQSTVVVRSERSALTLRLQGQMEFPTASGSWYIVRATGACANLDGEGRYSTTFSSTGLEFRLTFEGLLRT